jgi:DNA-binding CsgD family transcriptional regulator
MSYVTTSERQSLLTAEIAAVKTRQAFAQILYRVANAFGFKYAALMGYPSPESFLLKPLLIETNLPPAYVNQFDRARLMQLPFFSASQCESAVPQLWNLADKPSRFPDDIHNLNLSFELQVGICMLMHDADNSRLLFVFTGDRAVPGQMEINELTMITLHVLNAYRLVNASKASDHPPLSAREREVVRWTSQGKTSIEIGQILSLSDHTVNAYMTSAIKKLDCVNRTQLVAKAIRYKLIN